MLVDICCSVDSHYFFQRLREVYPKEELKGFFYDPNIHPYAEYVLRLMDVKRSCKKLGIKLIEGEYDVNVWLNSVSGLECEPEKGKRCDVCFDTRLEESAKKAKELGEKTLTTTLFMSPKKSHSQLSIASKKIEEKYGLEVVTPDFRVEGGSAEQFALAKRDGLYHQDYCGCIFALKDQRKEQVKKADELMSNIGKQIQPESIEYRINLYEKIVALEEENKPLHVRREKFLNYRLLRAYVKENKTLVPSYFLFYSTLKRRFSRGKIEKEKEGMGFFNREEIIFLSLAKFNELANTSYKSTKELIFSPPSVKTELHVRKIFSEDFICLSPIVIVDEVREKKMEIYCEAITYSDVRELLAPF